MFVKVATIAALASFEIYAAIPAGFALGLSPWAILAASILGGLAGVFVSAFLGDKIRNLAARYKKKKEEKPKTGLVHRIWNKYGIIGLGFLGTMTVGAPASIAVGMGFNAPLRKLIIWCCVGVLIRCTLFTIIGYHGAKLL
jgi:membrane protein YqaA with SNARE-associated domain